MTTWADAETGVDSSYYVDEGYVVGDYVSGSFAWTDAEA
jgi:hypothetical protein